MHRRGLVSTSLTLAGLILYPVIKNEVMYIYDYRHSSLNIGTPFVPSSVFSQYKKLHISRQWVRGTLRQYIRAIMILRSTVLLPCLCRTDSSPLSIIMLPRSLVPRGEQRREPHRGSRTCLQVNISHDGPLFLGLDFGTSGSRCIAINGALICPSVRVSRCCDNRHDQCASN